MKTHVLIFGMALLAGGGCASRQPVPEKPPEVKVVAESRPIVVRDAATSHRQLSAKQENLLRTFALKESPQLWQTVQSLRAEIDNRNKSLAQLAADLREFDRKPEDDATYRELQIGREQIACTLDNVYQKLENAYIAYKKFQATPSRKEYADAMNRALEDGVHEAEATARRYSVMSIEK